MFSSKRGIKNSIRATLQSMQDTERHCDKVEQEIYDSMKPLYTGNREVMAMLGKQG